MRRRHSSGNSAAQYTDMIMQNPNASSGFYIGWHYINSMYDDAPSNPPFIFEFYSSAATVAPLYVRLGSEMSNMRLTPQNYIVELNGVQIEFEPFVVLGINDNVGMTTTTFDSFSLGYQELNYGANRIRVMVRQNNYGFYGQGAPAFDHIRFENLGDTILLWRPKTYNLRNRVREFWNANAPYNLF